MSAKLQLKIHKCWKRIEEATNLKQNKQKINIFINYKSGAKTMLRYDTQYNAFFFKCFSQVSKCEKQEKLFL